MARRGFDSTSLVSGPGMWENTEVACVGRMNSLVRYDGMFAR